MRWEYLHWTDLSLTKIMEVVIFKIILRRCTLEPSTRRQGRIYLLPNSVGKPYGFNSVDPDSPSLVPELFKPHLRLRPGARPPGAELSKAG